MNHRIRLAMQQGTFDKMVGQIEADETFVVGLARFMHKDKRAKKIKGTGGAGKELVVGLLDRETRKVRVAHVADRKKKTLQAHVKANVEAGTEVFTDELARYAGLDKDHVHNVINHAESYVKGNIHTNGIENFWSPLKRSIKGTHVHVSPRHLAKYLAEFEFRWNLRQHPEQMFPRLLEHLAT